jgi:adenylate cyclase
VDAATRQRLIEAGVLDVDEDCRRDRQALVDLLLDLGIGVEEIVQAGADDRLPELAGDQLLAPTPTHTLRELAGELDVSIEVLERVIAAEGLPVPDPDQPDFTRAEIEMVQRLIPALDVFPEDAALQFLRVIGSSMARIAEAAVAAYLDNIERGVWERGGSELDHARSMHHAIGMLAEASTALAPLLARHLRVAVDRSRRAREGLSDFRTTRMAVGFVDLVGFTPLSRQLSVGDLADLIADFEAKAFVAASKVEGRVVKLIGDEVMFVALDAPSACEVALGLVEAFGGAGEVTPRAGLAIGELLTRDGDYFGPMVNLASRLAQLAVPGEVLAGLEIRDGLAATSELVASPAGRRMLKGFDEPVELVAITRT